MRENGALALVHKNQGRQPAHAITDDLKKRIVALKVSERYKNAIFKHFQGLLGKHEFINSKLFDLFVNRIYNLFDLFKVQPGAGKQEQPAERD